MRVFECGSSDPDDIHEAHVEFLLTLLSAAESAQRSWHFVQLMLLDKAGAIRGTTMSVRRPFWYPQDRDDVHTKPHFSDDIEVAMELQVGDLELEIDVDERVSPLEDNHRWTTHRMQRLQYVRKALADRRLASMRTGYEETARYGLQWTSDHEIHYESDFTPIEGKRLPRPPEPESTLGVISRLLCAQHAFIGPEHAGTWEDGRLIEARLFGADADDRVVGLLRDVEEPARVCASLQTLRLDDTAITQKGIALLRAFLPRVKLEITMR